MNNHQIAIDLNKQKIPPIILSGQKEKYKSRLPTFIRSTKKQYIEKWCVLLDGHTHSVAKVEKKIMRFNSSDLRTTFFWLMAHWAELELEKKGKWLDVAIDILTMKSKRKFNRQIEQDIIFKHLQTNSWSTHPYADKNTPTTLAVPNILHFETRPGKKALTC